MRRMLIAAALAFMVTTAVAAEAEKEGAQPTVKPKKISLDTNYDGKVDRIEIYDVVGDIQRVESDQNGDGIIDEWITFDGGKPVKKEKDTNADGIADVWVDY